MHSSVLTNMVTLVTLSLYLSLFIFLSSRSKTVMTAASFDLTLGTGVPLGQGALAEKPAKRNSKAAIAQEAALEPLHRLVYGRAGVAGERREALLGFQGFPPALAEEMTKRVLGLTKDKLSRLVSALQIPQRISVKQEELAQGVAAFLLAPSAPPVKKRPTPAAAGKKRSASTPAASAPSGAAPTKKRRGEPLEDTVRVAVFRRVLAMTCEQREEVSVKALRASIEAELGVDEGELKAMSDVIAEAATLTVRSLKEAEERGKAAA